MNTTMEQAVLRDQFIKKDEKVIQWEGVNVDKLYVDNIAEHCSEGSAILDVGAGTAHIAVAVTEKCGKDVEIIAVDLSKHLVNIAGKNTKEFGNVAVVRGDGYKLPFKDSSFDVVTIRLAPHSIIEAHRVLKRGGWYIHYACGQFNCFKEAHDIFGDRAEPYCPQNWWKTSRGRLERLDQRGFTDVYEKAFLVRRYYTLDQVIRHMKFDPIVKNFDQHRDMPKLIELKKKYATEKGIRITGDPLILMGRKR